MFSYINIKIKIHKENKNIFKFLYKSRLADKKMYPTGWYLQVGS